MRSVRLSACLGGERISIGEENDLVNTREISRLRVARLVVLAASTVTERCSNEPIRSSLGPSLESESNTTLIVEPSASNPSSSRHEQRCTGDSSR